MNNLAVKQDIQPARVNNLGDVGYPINPEYIGYDHKLKTYYIIDVNTKNLSFIQTAKDLQNLGVKNNKFFLKIFDPKLIGVDPYSPALTREQIQRIIVEVMRNPWYYLREIARIPEQGSAQGPGSGTPFQLHRGNLAAIYCFLNNINLYLVIPRQCGKTQSMLCILNWTYMFGTTNSEFSFVNKSQKDADENLARFKAQKDLLPLYLQQKYVFIDGELKQNKGIDNTRTIQNPLNKNRVVTKPSARTMESAENVGRGNTSPIQLFDEVEFTSYIGVIMKASGPALTYERHISVMVYANSLNCWKISNKRQSAA